MDEVRNELLGILSLMKKEENTLGKSLALSNLLDRFEYDLKDQKKHLEYKLQDINKNLECLQYVRKELKDELGAYYREEKEV